MKSYKISNKPNNFFLGGFITNLKNYEDRAYISINMKDGKETIYIMVFKKCGFGNKKYDNPTVQLIIDAFEQGIPISCVYNNNGQSNVMECIYTNFSLNKQVSKQETATEIPIVQKNEATEIESSESSADETTDEAELENEFKQLSLFDIEDNGEMPF